MDQTISRVDNLTQSGRLPSIRYRIVLFASHWILSLIPHISLSDRLYRLDSAPAIHGPIPHQALMAASQNWDTKHTHSTLRTGYKSILSPRDTLSSEPDYVCAASLCQSQDPPGAGGEDA